MKDFATWCSESGGYLNDSDDAARAARLMALAARNGRDAQHVGRQR